MYFLARMILLAAFGIGAVCAVAVIAAAHPWSTILVTLFVFGRMVRRGGLNLWGMGTAHWCSVQEMKRAKMI
jgi:hypothetical protein